MIDSTRNIFKIPDLRRKILITLFILLIYRLGCHIPTPGINAAALGYILGQLRGTVFGLYDIFVGGALRRAAIFSLGVMPYISASIIFQLLGSVYPNIAKLQRDEEGRRKINQWTRYLTVLLGAVQAMGYAIFLESQGATPYGSIITHPGFGFRFVSVLTMTSGTILAMWLGEMITEKGIGNGISFLIFVGCLDEWPMYLSRTVSSIRAGSISFFSLIGLLLLIFAIFAFVVLITQAVRKIPVQYPKRIIGRKIYGGQSTFIPLRVTTAGVIPIIFAQSLIIFPSTFLAFFKSPFSEAIKGFLAPGTWFYSIVYALLIIYFTYFYTSVVFNPQDLADNMQRYGGFIPGIRPGERTKDFIDNVLSRITLPGSIFLAFIALLPFYLMNQMHVPFYFGGTTLLIIVGVALDTIQQIQSQLLMRHYEGLLKTSRIRGRRY